MPILFSSVEEQKKCLQCKHVIRIGDDPTRIRCRAFPLYGNPTEEGDYYWCDVVLSEPMDCLHNKRFEPKWRQPLFLLFDVLLMGKGRRPICLPKSKHASSVRRPATYHVTLRRRIKYDCLHWWRNILCWGAGVTRRPLSFTRKMVKEKVPMQMWKGML